MPILSEIRCFRRKSSKRPEPRNSTLEMGLSVEFEPVSSSVGGRGSDPARSWRHSERAAFLLDQIDSNRAGRVVSADNALALRSERPAHAEIDIGIILKLSEKIAALTIEGVKAAFHEPVIVQLVTRAAANIAIALIWRPKIE